MALARRNSLIDLHEGVKRTGGAMVAVIVQALLDCGARVVFGGCVARTRKHCEAIYQTTDMSDVSRRPGAGLVDFVAVSARRDSSGTLWSRDGGYLPDHSG
jgi:hypothetical protein